MCIVVDPPLFVPIFKSTDPQYDTYDPIRRWIAEGSGKFVLGGTSYKNELGRVASILPALLELERKGKVVRVSTVTVDREEAHVKVIEPRADFDDPHLVALVRATGCKLICVNDPRSHKFLRATRLYASTKLRPSLYTRPKNRGLLCPSNIAGCCK